MNCGEARRLDRVDRPPSTEGEIEVLALGGKVELRRSSAGNVRCDARITIDPVLEAGRGAREKLEARE